MQCSRIKKKIKSATDIVVIGSSPILILAAISFSKKGKRVTLIAESSNWGGSWESRYFQSYAVETSCHLLESYSAVHNILLKRFKVTIAPCPKGKEPVKLIRDNSTSKIYSFPYHSRKNILCELYARVIRSTISLLKVLLGLGDRKKNTSSFFYSISDLYFFLRHRLVQIVKLEPLYWPRNGWSSFLEEITQSLLSANVLIVNACATSIARVDGHTQVTTSTQQVVSADLVVVGQSTVLKNVNFDDFAGVNLVNQFIPKEYPHYLIQVRCLPTFLDFPLYIHTPQSTIIHRITSIESAYDERLFLVQARETELSSQKIVDEMHSILDFFMGNQAIDRHDYHSITLHSARELVNVQIVERYLPKAIDLSLARKIRPGLYNDILLIRTVGDIARNIVQYDGIIF